MKRHYRSINIGLLGGLAAITAIPSLANADAVALNPAIVDYTISLPSSSGNRAMTSGTMTASGGGFQASAAFSAGTVVSAAVTVEAGYDYATSLEAYSDGTRLTKYYDWNNVVAVPSKLPGDPIFHVDVAYQVPVADLAVTINLTGGTLQYANIWAMNSGGTGYSYKSPWFGGGSNTTTLVVAQSSQIWVSGEACGEFNGTWGCRNLAQQAVAFGANGGSVTWNVGAGTSSLAGTMTTTTVGLSPSDITGRYIEINGPERMSKPTNSDGTYAFDNLLEGNYWIRPYLFLKQPFNFTYLPNVNVQLTPGTATQHDIDATLVHVQQDLHVTGFFDNSNLQSSAMLYSHGQGSLQGAVAYEYGVELVSGRIDMALMPGDWTPINGYYWLLDATPEPERRLYERVSRYDYGSSITIPPASAVTLPTRTDDLVETKIVFDYQEELGTPEVSIRNVRFYASSTDNGVTRQVEAFGPTVPLARPALRIALEPGSYWVWPSMMANDTVVSFPGFPFEVAPAVVTDAGTSVPVSLPSSGIDLTFEQTTSGGLTVATSSPIGPQPPMNFQLTTDPPMYYDITTTATFVGLVEVCISYDPNTVDPGLAGNLKMMHYDQKGTATTEDDEWMELLATVDVDNHRVCGLTDSFSIFALMLSTIDDVDGDGVPGAGDNCVDVSNADQLDSDGDGEGDACDADDDDDGVNDEADECPLAFVSLDADGDGCADLVTDLCPLVQSLGLPKGTETALCATSSKAALASTSGLAKKNLDTFINQVAGFSHNVISPQTAVLLSSFAQNAKSNLP